MIKKIWNKIKGLWDRYIKWIFNGFYLNENNEPIGAQSKLLPLKWYNGISDDKILWESIAKLVGEKDIDLVIHYAEKYANYLFFDDLWEYLYFKKDSNYKQLAKDRDKKEQEWESELAQQITGDIDIHDEFGNEITGEDHEPYDM
mgnify:CR=1 FL=1